jgi:NO-binding membrane sensor protein with MHYT domain
MEQENPTKKPVNWYSGWRGLATAAATVLGAKLIGILGAVIALIVFHWLQPRRGTWQALAAAAVVGGVVAVAYTALVLPQFTDQQAAPAARNDGSFTYEEAIGQPPPKR